MDQVQLLKSSSQVLKNATMAEIQALGMFVLGLHNALHARDFTDDGPDFADSAARTMEAVSALKAAYPSKDKKKEDKKVEKDIDPGDSTEADDLFAKLKRLISGNSGTEDVDVENVKVVAKSSEEVITMGFEEDKRLITGLVLRPGVPDLHGDVYDAEEVEKAAHNFSLYCQQGNIQHVADTDQIKFVETSVAKADFTVGGFDVKKGDWIVTAFVADEELWTEKVLTGEFTGFSIGCKAMVERL